jgi:hypothetical protein
MSFPVRLSLWLGLAAASAVVAAITVLFPAWLETIFGLDPDGGSGAAEWLIVVASAAVSLLSMLRVAVRLGFAR